MPFTCPDCGMTSHNPSDERFGYCGNCHTFPSDKELRRLDAERDTGFSSRLDAGWMFDAGVWIALFLATLALVFLGGAVGSALGWWT